MASQLGDDFVIYPRGEEIIDKVLNFIRTGRRKDEADCLALVGPSGAGKTKLVNQITDRKEFRQFRTDEGDISPLVYLIAPTKATTKSIAEAILRQLGDPRPNRGTQPEMVDRVVHQLKEQKTQILVIDEIQHLTSSYEAADFFKVLLNMACCPLLLVGLSTALELFRNNPQLERRARPPIKLDAFDWHKSSDQMAFRRILKSFEALLKGRADRLDITSLNMAARLHCSSRGLIGRLTPLLRDAVSIADSEGSADLSIHHLSAAHQLRSEIANDKSMNPFEVKLLPENWSSASFETGVNQKHARRQKAR